MGHLRWACSAPVRRVRPLRAAYPLGAQWEVCKSQPPPVSSQVQGKRRASAWVGWPTPTAEPVVSWLRLVPDMFSPSPLFSCVFPYLYCSSISTCFLWFNVQGTNYPEKGIGVVEAASTLSVTAAGEAIGSRMAWLIIFLVCGWSRFIFCNASIYNIFSFLHERIIKDITDACISENDFWFFRPRRSVVNRVLWYVLVSKLCISFMYKTRRVCI